MVEGEPHGSDRSGDVRVIGVSLVVACLAFAALARARAASSRTRKDAKKTTFRANMTQLIRPACSRSS